MKLELYQVPHLLLNSSTYLGSLNQPVYYELNVNLNNLRNIKLILPVNYSNYNYIKVIDGGKFYYYILDNFKYYNNDQVELDYRLDVVRTFSERRDGDLDVRLTKFSELIDFNNLQKESYFWKNQDIKLSGEIFKDKNDIIIDTNHSQEVREYLSETKWLYIWLQPKSAKADDGANVAYQYKLTQRISENTISVLDKDLPKEKATWDKIQKSWTIGFATKVNWPSNFIVGQIYYATDTQKYYEFREWSGSSTSKYRMFFVLNNYENDNVWYIKDLNPLTNQFLPTSAYCIVLPTQTMYVNYPGRSQRKWDANSFLNIILDGDKEESWLPNIIDMQISNMPPINLSEFNITKTYDYLTITSDFYGLQGLHGTVEHYKSGEKQTLYDFIPALTYKLSEPIKYNSDFKLVDKINQETLIYNKHYLSMFENRVELDIPLLVNDNALQLYLYEDIQPGRSTVMLGFAPEKNTLEYLIHSASTLLIDRDLSLPIFTTAYEQYVSTNKNFVKQAELSRNTQLQQGLVNSGSQVLGASAVSLSMESYNPSNTLVRAAGGAANTLIAYNAQKKQFNWSVDNMKSAPGNYKGASATTSIILTLMMSGYWIENYTSTEFDKHLYADVISEIGYDYFDMRFKLSEVLDKLNNGLSQSRGFIQGRLIGIDFEDYELNILSYILNEELIKGVKVYL